MVQGWRLCDGEGGELCRSHEQKKEKEEQMSTGSEKGKQSAKVMQDRRQPRKKEQRSQCPSVGKDNHTPSLDTTECKRKEK